VSNLKDENEIPFKKARRKERAARKEAENTETLSSPGLPASARPV
jgi:hypothetical protein